MRQNATTIHFPIFSSAIISICIYIFFVFAIFLYLGKSVEAPKKYTSNKDNFLDVTIVSRDENKKKQAPPKAEKQENAKEIKKENNVVLQKQAKKTSPKRTNLQELFKGIKTSNLKDVKQIPQKKEETVQSRLKPSKTSNLKSASSLVKTLEIAPKQEIREAKSSGIYDEFYGKVYEILMQAWQTTIDTDTGLYGIVQININKNGNFSYKIVRLSYNSGFNSKLRDFLSNMESVKFPIPSDGENILLEVTFKEETQ